MTSYTQDPGFSHFGVDRPAPERTSVLAILSLVFGILCVPFFGVLGLGFGVGALLGIKASRGRVGGTGLAVAGIVVSLIACALWIGLLIGAAQVATRFANEAKDITLAAQGRDETVLKRYFTPSAAAQVTPEALDRFARALTEHVGPLERGPKGLMEYGTWTNEMSAADGAAKAKGLLEKGMPIPMRFEKGKALVIVEFDASGMSLDFSMRRPDPKEGGHVTNLAVVTPDGKITQLLQAP
ncbi:MAG: DUF4190 domain-containing protein [Phycisphaerales bacterium]|nr:DUF4190 domain-containing protein [Phycisphaerales bacterium]